MNILRSIRDLRSALIVQSTEAGSSMRPERPAPQLTTHDLVFVQEYLVNNYNYMSNIDRNLAVPIQLDSGSKIQQLLTLNQALLVEEFSIQNAQQYNETGLKVKQYIDNLIKPQNPDWATFDKDTFYAIGGGIASCGYHAVRNCKLLIEAFFSPGNTEFSNSIKELYKIKEADQLLGTPEVNAAVGNNEIVGAWRDIIIKDRDEKNFYDELSEQGLFENGDWLIPTEMLILTEHVMPNLKHLVSLYCCAFCIENSSTNNA